MASDVLAELEALDQNRAVPPPILYKYVVPDRVDVLENASIRFTPPLNTNDIFEVRQTFDLVMGPKMQSYFNELSQDVDLDDSLTSALKDSPLATLSSEHIKVLYNVTTGGDAETDLRAMLAHFLDRLPSLMNAPDMVERFLDKMAAGQILLSLTERSDSSPMWAHYAANSTGFVIGLDTKSPFFRRGEKVERQGLHKVSYFDGRVGEIIDNPYAALISKQADWAYEREWRLYLKTEQAAEVRNINGDAIHLVPFPRQAVERVVLGVRTTSDVEAEIRQIIESSYPGARITRMQPDRLTASLVEVEVR